MSNYTKQIDGQYDLNQINLQIAGEEAGASEFISSAVDGTPPTTNRVTFRELAPGTVPKTLSVVKSTDPQPPGTTNIWSGVMVVNRTSTNVIAYRQS
jgi:hypothetical protein